MGLFLLGLIDRACFLCVCSSLHLRQDCYPRRAGQAPPHCPQHSAFFSSLSSSSCSLLSVNVPIITSHRPRRAMWVSITTAPHDPKSVHGSASHPNSTYPLIPSMNLSDTRRLAGVPAAGPQGTPFREPLLPWALLPSPDCGILSACHRLVLDVPLRMRPLSSCPAPATSPCSHLGCSRELCARPPATTTHHAGHAVEGRIGWRASGGPDSMRNRGRERVSWKHKDKRQSFRQCRQGEAVSGAP